MSTSTPSRHGIALAFLAVYVCWGSTYLAIRFTLETLPPFGTAGVRFVLASLLMLAWLALRGHLGGITRAHWKSSAVVGLFLFAGGNGGVVWAQQRIASSMAALIIATTPLWMALLDWAWNKGPAPGRPQLAGLGMGLLGIVVLAEPSRLSGASHVDPVGALAVLAATLSWVVGSVYSKRLPLPESPFVSTALELLCGGIWLLLLSLVAGESARVPSLSAVSTRSLVAFGYLVLFGSICGFSAYIYLLKHTTPTRAVTYSYVNPVFAVLLGWAVAEEELSLRTLIACALIIPAVILVLTARPSPSHREGVRSVP